nr:MAG: putative capsid protein 2 [Polycipiviridae sp.]
MNTNTETLSETHNPVRNMGLPQNPVPQTNTGLLEHTGLPITPFENITTILPDFSWMTSQFKVLSLVTASSSDAVGRIIYTNDILHPKNSNSGFINTPCWERLPFGSAVWWKGIVSFRFTIIKPPRVVGKFLVRYRQDAFQNYASENPAVNSTVKDATFRSILKEWDLSDTNHFEFDVSASLPIRARPCKFPGIKNISGSSGATAYAQNVFPWIDFSMGAISLEVAERISPGSIFPDTYTIIVERAFKNTEFMTPTDTKSTYLLAVQNSPYYTT